MDKENLILEIKNYYDENEFNQGKNIKTLIIKLISCLIMVILTVGEIILEYIGIDGYDSKSDSDMSQILGSIFVLPFPIFFSVVILISTFTGKCCPGNKKYIWLLILFGFKAIIVIYLMAYLSFSFIFILGIIISNIIFILIAIIYSQKMQ